MKLLEIQDCTECKWHYKIYPKMWALHIYNCLREGQGIEDPYEIPEFCTLPNKEDSNGRKSREIKESS